MNKLYISLDGDDAGGQIGQAVLRDDASMLHEISSKIDAGSQVVKDWAAANGATVISIGGDEANLMMDPSKREAIQELKQRYEQAAGVTLTIGTGLSLSQAGKSLMAGKLSGKNVIMNYDDHVEQVLSQAHDGSGQENEDPEAKKINEHYLNPTMDGQSGQNEELGQDESASLDQEMADQGMPSQEDQLEDADQDESCDCPICSGDQGAPPGPRSGENTGLDIQGSPTKGEDSVDDDFSLELPEGNALKQQDEEGLEDMESSSEDVKASPEDDIKSPIAGEADSEEDGMDDMQDEAPPSPDMAQEDGDPDQAGLPPDASGDMGDNAPPPSSPDMGQEPSPNMAAQPPSPDMAQEDGQGGDLNLLSELLADSQSQGDVKQKISTILEKFKANRDLIISMKQSNPDLYVGIIGLLKQTIDMAKQAGLQSPVSSPDMARESAPSGGLPPSPKM